MPAIQSFSDMHLEGALRLSQAAGWPHRRPDWELVAALSDGVAALENGEVVGTGFCTPFGDQVRLNMIIVAARLRGRGIGRRLMDALMARAGARGIGLVATAEGQPLYQKLGFAPTGRILQYQGEVTSVPTPERAVRPGTAADLDAIRAMDRAAFGAPRDALLQRIAAQGQVFVAERGFALLRSSGRGQTLGPLVAADEATARALIAAVAGTVQGRFLRIDIPAGAELGPVLETAGLVHVGGGTAMQHGAAPQPPEKFMTYALASQALG